MKPPPRGLRARPRGVRAGVRATRRAASLLLACLALAAPAGAAPFIWDDDEDGIDDRVETVHLLGYEFSFENADPLLRQRIEVIDAPSGLLYGVYVVYDDTPTQADLDTLALLGMPVLHRFEAVPAVRSVASFLQVQLASQLAGVDRIEAIPLLYPQVREAAASSGVRDPSCRVFPTWAGDGGADGDGSVVAILDSGVNDAPHGDYPGHEALIGRCLGGASFVSPDSSLNTPQDGSVNPVDFSPGAHGTHVAGIVLGDGCPSGFAAGIAPGARFVDVKVLGDAGLGTSVPEAIDWCIHNRERDWIGDPEWAGIDVINLSVSSLDASDGNDIGARIAQRAIELGVAVVASTGNEGLAGYVPSPASGDGVLAVGAWDTQRTPGAADDLFPAFSDYGPRASDGDADAHDEQKPDLVAPGVAVLSADGRLSTDGAQYRRLTGTSMSAALVSGAVALLRSAYPALAPLEIADLLRATARRNVTGLPPAAPGPDPRWNAPIGFGVLDLHAARLEREQPERSQVRRLVVAGDADRLDVEIWTQRERGTAHFVLESRCVDAGGTCAWSPVDSVAAAGDPSLADPANTHVYALTVPLAAQALGDTAEYRVSWTEDGVRHDGPALRVVHPAGPPVATVEVTIVHNAYDSDVDATIEIGGTQGAPAVEIPLGGSGATVSNEWVNGSSTLGNVAWTFHVPVPSGVEAFLPPASGQRWRLRVTEGGFVNRSGRVTDFRVVDHTAGDQAHQGGPTPRQTLEGQTWWVETPVPTSDVEPAGAAALRFGPNPARRGQRVRFIVPRDPGGVLAVFDLAGRRVAAAPFVRAGDVWRSEWNAGDAAGRDLAPGLYFVRAGAGPVRRIAILDH